LQTLVEVSEPSRRHGLRLVGYLLCVLVLLSTTWTMNPLTPPPPGMFGSSAPSEEVPNGPAPAEETTRTSVRSMLPERRAHVTVYVSRAPLTAAHAIRHVLSPARCEHQEDNGCGAPLRC